MLLLALIACHPKTVDTEPTCAGTDVISPQGDPLDTCVADEVCLDGVGCVVCTPTLTPELSALTPVIVETGAGGAFRTRPVEVALAGEGAVALTVEGPLEVLDADGLAIHALPTLPATVYVRATGVGPGSLTAAFSGGATVCESVATLDFHAVVASPLVGRPRTVAPGWESVASVLDTEPVTLGLDPVRFADRVGLPFDAYVVAHRTAEEWAIDPGLSDVTGGPEPGVVTAGALNTTPLWASPPLVTGDVLASYDVVVDFGADGQLDPEDLIDGFDETGGVARIGDLSLRGPHAVEQGEFSGGSFLGQRVYWPGDIATMGARPLIVISHGNGHQYDCTITWASTSRAGGMLSWRTKIIPGRASRRLPRRRSPTPIIYWPTSAPSWPARSTAWSMTPALAGLDTPGAARAWPTPTIVCLMAT